MNIGISDVAKATGFSVATVSRAVRGLPTVTLSTRQKIERAAKRLGYKPMPLVGAVLSSVRRRKQTVFLGNLAVVAIQRPPGGTLLDSQKQLLAGAKARAKELGFSLSLHSYVVGQSKPSVLRRILHCQRVQGIIFHNSNNTVDFTDFDWTNFAAVQIDYPLTSPSLPTIGIDHHRTLANALAELNRRNYRRIGFFIELPKDVRLAYRWSGAFLAYQSGPGGIGRVPVLECEKIDRVLFLRWFSRHRPDLLVGHKPEVIDWLESEGVRVPADVGFFALNRQEAGEKCAGLNLLVDVQGRVAVESVVGRIHNFDVGIPRNPTTSLVEGRMEEGQTILPLRN
jgi:LacI family transcriptional regulator